MALSRSQHVVLNVYVKLHRNLSRNVCQTNSETLSRRKEEDGPSHSLTLMVHIFFLFKHSTVLSPLMNLISFCSD